MKEDNKNEVTVENLAVLAKVALRLCDMVVMCAPPFAAGSLGAQTVAMARDVRPRLVGMVAAFERKAQKPAPAPQKAFDAPADTGKDAQ